MDRVRIAQPRCLNCLEDIEVAGEHQIAVPRAQPLAWTCARKD